MTTKPVAQLIFEREQKNKKESIEHGTWKQKYNQHSSCSACAYYAKCAIVSGIATCACQKGYEGDPLTYCKRLECVDNSECSSHLVCKQGRCIDPCDGMCGVNAQCQVHLHIPVCSCPAGYTGRPTEYCRRFDPCTLDSLFFCTDMSENYFSAEICHPNPCGPNTNCQVYNYTAVCECLPGFMGSPLAGCRHECDYDGDCGLSLACIDNKCQNPCYTKCGQNAECIGVKDHAAICKCPQGYYGRADISCRPECTSNSECPSYKPLCSLYTCKDPCESACGVNAKCDLRGITPICSCPPDTVGSPYEYCRPYTKEDICSPNPCGVNTKCESGSDDAGNERPVCTCLPGYFGNALTGCIRGECSGDEDCLNSEACINYRCVNACMNMQCGTNAECSPRNHIAGCSCPPGHNGDALEYCHPVYSEPYIQQY
ncbi:endoglin-related [Holotrichia oblita]|uniref:Endoglin-related n=1 Tax=Holotrichia oblita TaxID=644536 RepID=A0ACB9SSK7_HOLOL|nr:endoglin-related [Holotrichia oblita]